jgi:hypothetical protein
MRGAYHTRERRGAHADALERELCTARKKSGGLCGGTFNLGGGAARPRPIGIRPDPTCAVGGFDGLDRRHHERSALIHRENDTAVRNSRWTARYTFA